VLIIFLLVMIFISKFKSFMFESSLGLALTEWGEKTCGKLDDDYRKCWDELQVNFDKNMKI